MIKYNDSFDCAAGGVLYFSKISQDYPCVREFLYKQEQQQKRCSEMASIKIGRRFGKTQMTVNALLNKFRVVVIPLYIWILLKFVKPKEGVDSEIIDGHEYKTILKAKKLFKRVYITETSQYVDGELKSHHKLRRKETYFV